MFCCCWSRCCCTGFLSLYLVIHVVSLNPVYTEGDAVASAASASSVLTVVIVAVVVLVVSGVMIADVGFAGSGTGALQVGHDPFMPNPVNAASTQIYKRNHTADVRCVQKCMCCRYPVARVGSTPLQRYNGAVGCMPSQERGHVHWLSDAEARQACSGIISC